jgi:hypothetical protein
VLKVKVTTPWSSSRLTSPGDAAMGDEAVMVLSLLRRRRTRRRRAQPGLS